MASMISERQHGGNGGTVHLLNNELAEHLTRGDKNDDFVREDLQQRSKMVLDCEPARDQTQRCRPQSTPNPSSRGRTAHADPSLMIDHTLKLQAWLNDKTVKAIQQTSDTEAKDMKKIYDDVLETEDTFAKDMEGLVDHREILNVRKKEILHKKWRDAVDGPLSTEVTRVMNGPQYRDLVHRKRLLYKEYLEHVNKKGHVFLDTIAPEEYYPLALYPVRPSMLVAETSTLGDPLLMTERQRCGEERVIVRCMTGSTLKDRDLQQIRLPPVPLVPLGRHGTGCDTWLAMPIADIESPVRLASSAGAAFKAVKDERLVLYPARSIETWSHARRRMTATANASHFRLDAWGRAASQSLVDTEMRIQKRRPRPQSEDRKSVV